MTYTDKNISNLRVRRGGTAEYLITHVNSSYILIKHLYSGRENDFQTRKALEYLTKGKWTVVGEGGVGVTKRNKIEQVYQIY